MVFGSIVINPRRYAAESSQENQNMSDDCGIAFKEWAVICDALATGRQTLILRKGGIHEGHAGFRVAHRTFWLFPTYLHQDDRHKLAEEAWSALDKTLIERPREKIVALQLLAEVTDVIELADPNQASRLNGLHWWSDQTLTERFNYKTPGLFLLLVRVSKLTQAHEIANSPHFAGCRSWVELTTPLTTSRLVPVLNDVEFAARRSAIRAAVGSVG
jgi:hypothetical protein